jgi:carbon monoxide dehydrogenase subunit G
MSATLDPAPPDPDGRTIVAVSDAATRYVEIGGAPAQVWAFLWDADALGRVLPGCESIHEEAPGRYALVVAVRTSLLTVRADAIAEIREAVVPHRAVLTLDGTPRGIGGAFHVEVPLDLVEEAGGQGMRTRIGYDVEVRVSGGLAAFGTGMLREAIERQIRGLAADIEAEILAGRAPDAGAY